MLIFVVNVGIVVALVMFIDRGTGKIDLPPSTHSTTGTPKATAAPAADVADLVDAERDLTIAVLGDGTGDEDGEWVQVLAKLLGGTHRVTLHSLDTSDPTKYAKAEEFGTEGHAATIWNGSRRGASADYAAARLDFLIPDAPDAVVLSYGRDNTATDVGPQLSRTYSAIRAKWPTAPVLVTLQAQDRDDAIEPVRAAAADWAAAHQVQTIDVAGAFDKAGNPNRYVSVVDPPSVNS